MHLYEIVQLGRHCPVKDHTVILQQCALAQTTHALSLVTNHLHVFGVLIYIGQFGKTLDIVLTFPEV